MVSTVKTIQVAQEISSLATILARVISGAGIVGREVGPRPTSAGKPQIPCMLNHCHRQIVGIFS